MTEAFVPSAEPLRTFRIKRWDDWQVQTARDVIYDCVKRAGAEVVREVSLPPSEAAPLGEIRILARLK